MRTSLTYGDVKWTLANLLTLRVGEWPEPKCYEIELISKRRAKFDTGPMDAAAEVERRLSMCGLDGLMVKQVYAWGESIDYLALNLRMDRRAVSKGISASLAYITGKWPKERTYSQHKLHRKGGKK